jgi:8-oxo-dGTP pyrophosphatase MutT (NUDIX family)
MRPIKLRKGKASLRTQFGALCYRVRNDKVQVLLITSRNTGRWIVPKGWPMDGHSPQQAALTEAWEEAGVIGKARGNALGIYSYNKANDDKKWPCVVAVFPVKVARLEKDFPEVKERKRKWFSRKKAASLVHEPELQQMIRYFEPRLT